MKNVTLFIFTAALTACLSYSSRSVIGSDPKPVVERPLALSGMAIVNGCEVTGRLVRKDDGIYAVLDCSNPSGEDAAVQFHYAVHCTPASSPMMRMLPMPSMIRQDRFDCRLAAGGRKTTETMVKEDARPKRDRPAAKAALALTSAGQLLRNPESWSLTVSTEEIKGAPGWGGSPPAAAPKGTILEKGILVLTRVLEDVAQGAS